MTFPAYPEYKDSGVEWLGLVPSQWVVIPAKYKVRTLSGGQTTKNKVSDEYIEGLYPAFSASGQDVWMEDYEFNTEGVVLSAVGARCGKTFKADGKWGVVANTHCLFPNQDVSRDYLWWLTNNEDWWEKGGTAQPFVKVSDSLARKIAFPNLQEQIVISEFLKHETRKIDELIQEQQQLIELLNEKRQSVISNAVCRGLDLEVQMKHSGVEWLGLVPEHWDVKALKHIVSIPITDGPHETPEFIDEGVPFVSAEAVSSGVVDFSKIRGFISRESHEKYSLKYFPKRGDIFMVKSGATTGVCAIVETDDEFNIWSPLAVVRCMDDIEPNFVLNYMRSLNFQEAIALNWNFGTQQNIGMGVIEKLMIPVPPHREQIQISKRLSEFLKESNDLISEASNGITLLKERRSALITAAVTGQIDVRNYQPRS